MFSRHRFSYFEFWDLTNDIFVSLFPTEKTTITDSSNFPDDNQPVFGNFFSFTDVDFTLIMKSLKENKLGFYDTFWFVPPGKTHMTLVELQEWMLSLKYHPCHQTPHYHQYRITSDLDPDFSQIVYVKNESLPQEAIDVVPVFISEHSKQHVVLGWKKQSPVIKISSPLSDEPIDILTVGLYGSVLFGEHLEKDEKAKMDELASSFKNKPIYMKDKEVSAALRTILEEGGFELKSDNCECYYIHTDTMPSRDPRYWTYDFEDHNFGYTRESRAHTVLVMIEGKIPETMPDPKDHLECSKGMIVERKRAIETLLQSGAFFSHVYQLSIALNSDILKSKEMREFDRKFIGKPIIEARKTYNEMRIGVIEGSSILVEKTYDKNRMNVSIAVSGFIDRILGFY